MTWTPIILLLCAIAVVYQIYRSFKDRAHLQRELEEKKQNVRELEAQLSAVHEDLEAIRLRAVRKKAGLTYGPKWPKKAAKAVRKRQLELLGGEWDDEDGPPWTRPCPTYKDGLCRGEHQLEPGLPCRTYRCSGCGNRTPWCNGAADETPEFCDSCWAEAEGDKTTDLEAN